MSPEKLEKALNNKIVRAFLRHLAKRDKDGNTSISEVIKYNTKNKDDFSFIKRFKYSSLSSFFKIILNKLKIDYHLDNELSEIVARYPRIPSLLAQSVGELGVSAPQNFSAPLLIVWNFTNACNLRCKHCYQNAGAPLPDELSLKEKLNVVDQMIESGVCYLAFSGGEPLVSKDFFEVAKHAADGGLHTTIATNGTLLTEEIVERLVDVGIKFVSISLDSVHPEVHDEFRGVPGSWNKTVEGIKKCVAEEGLQVEIAATVTAYNFDDIEGLIKFGIDLGVDGFCAFNFVPTGAGKNIVSQDISPIQREQLLLLLNKYLNKSNVTTYSTAPQYGRVCQMASSFSEMSSVGHYLAVKSEVAQKITRYIGGCGSGRMYCALQPNGIITPCVFMPIEVGDVRSEKLIDIWQNAPLFKVLRDRDNLEENCKVCKYRDICGGCRARAYAYFGRVTAPDPGCIYNLKEWEKIKEGKDAKSFS